MDLHSYDVSVCVFQPASPLKDILSIYVLGEDSHKTGMQLQGRFYGGRAVGLRRKDRDYPGRPDEPSRVSLSRLRARRLRSHDQPGGYVVIGALAVERFQVLTVAATERPVVTVDVSNPAPDPFRGRRRKVIAVERSGQFFEGFFRKKRSVS